MPGNLNERWRFICYGQTGKGMVSSVHLQSINSRSIIHFAISSEYRQPFRSISCPCRFAFVLSWVFIFQIKIQIVYCCMQYNHFLLTCTCTQNDWTKSLKGLRPKRKVFRSPYISWKCYLEEKYLFIQVACELILTGPIGITGMSIFRMVTSCLASIKTSLELIWTKFADSCQSSNLNQLKGHSSIKEANKCTQVDRVY